MKVLVISRYTNLVRHRSEAEIFIGLANLGVLITIMTNSDSPFENIFIKSGIKVISHHPESRFSHKSVGPIRNELLNEDYDILHLFNSKSIPAGIRAARGINVKIITYRGAKGPYWHDLSAYFSHFHPKVKAVVCISEYVKSSLKKQRVISMNKLHVIKKGVDMTWFHPVDVFPYAFKSINPTCKIVTCVAHLRPVKGVDYLIQATQILEEFDDLHFVFIGKGTDTKQFQEKISKLPNSTRLHGFGDIDDIRPHIKACDIYVQPSISEGLAKSLIEAMAYSKPIITTRSGGPQEIITDQVSGKIVPVRDPEAIAKAIIELNSDNRNAKNLGKAANAFLLRELKIETTIKKTFELYKKII
tara:strand:- start:4174 stop:5250 length:1077 start_codon:yes stop_codon:yes gene_type:complete